MYCVALARLRRLSVRATLNSDDGPVNGAGSRATPGVQGQRWDLTLVIVPNRGVFLELEPRLYVQC